MAAGSEKFADSTRQGLIGHNSPTEERLRLLLAAWPENRDQFAQLAAATEDWTSVLKLAQRHGVVGILCQPWRQKCFPWPAAIESYEQDGATGERLWTNLVCSTLTEVIIHFRSAQVTVVPLKGPLLAERLYGDATARFSLDLDLLIAPADLSQATVVLESLGYKPQIGAAAHYYLRHHHHLLFQHLRKPPIELHFRLFTGFGVSLDSPEILSRTIDYQTQEGVACRILAAEDEFLFLAIHAAGHGFQRLCWLCDLKYFLQKHSNLNWLAIFASADSAGLATALSFTLEIQRRRLGLPNEMSLPAQAFHYKDHWPATRFLSWVEQMPEGSLRSKAGWLFFQASLCARPGKSLWYLQHHFLRIARRRLHRFLPAVVPDDWSG